MINLSLIKPILSSIIPFDATEDYILTFSVSSGGDQITGNRLVIYNNSTNTLVYDTTVANYLYTHTIASGSLSNNIQYKAQIYTENSSSVFSTASDWILFYCYAPGIVTINVAEGGTINAQQYTFIGTYVQNSDPIKSYRFLLYDSNSTLITSYPEVISSTISQLVISLENNVDYHIELITLSQSGVEVSTGLIGFTASYIVPALTSDILLTNLPDSGAVEIDILAVEIYVTGNNYTFEDSDWINVTATGAYVYLDKRLDLITSDFTLRLHMKNVPTNTVFCTITGLYGTITIKYYNNRFRAYKTAGGITSYFVNDTDITPTSTDMVCVELKQISNLLDLTAEIYT